MSSTSSMADAVRVGAVPFSMSKKTSIYTKKQKCVVTYNCITNKKQNSHSTVRKLACEMGGSCRTFCVHVVGSALAV